MEAIEALTSRVSGSKLVEPAPNELDLHSLLSAATRAPDHGKLRPWQFIVVRGDAHVSVSVEGIPDLTFLTVDGQEALQLRVGDQVCCRRSEHSVRLVRMGETGFFDVLRSKLSWGER